MKRKLAGFLMLVFTVLALLPLAAQAIMVEPDDNTCMYGGGEHTWSDWYTMEEATCIGTGSRQRYCNICQWTQTEVIPALGHDWGEWETVTAAACLTDGLKVRVCSRCGSRETETIPAMGHDWVSKEVEPATCVTPGVVLNTCSRCGAQDYGNSAYLPHNYVTEIVQAATCTGTGLSQEKCSMCGDVRSQTEIPALGHTPQTVAGFAATCTEAGLTEGSTCSRCGAVLTAQTAIPALGHSPVAVAGFPATCTEAGLTEGSTCSRCGAVLTAQQTIPALGHDYEATEYKEATAAEDGYIKFVCTRCWDSYTEILPRISHDHNFVPVAGTPATCTEAGVNAYACTICGESYSESAPALGHIPTAVPGKMPTCTEPGLTEGSVCSRCGAVLAAQMAIPATGHNWGEWTVIKEATATADGQAMRTCKNNTSHAEYYTIPATGETETVHPAMNATATWNPAAGEGKCYEDAVIPYHITITNTGDCPLIFDTGFGDVKNITGPSGPVTVGTQVTLQPGQTLEYDVDGRVADNHVTNKEFYNGRTVMGYYDDAGEEKSIYQFLEIIIPLTEPEDEGPHPAIDVYLWADPDAGAGKRYAYARVPFHCEVTNTGDCPVYVPWWSDAYPEFYDESAPNGRTQLPGQDWGTAMLNPGETYSVVWNHYFDGLVGEIHVVWGYKPVQLYGLAWYYRADGEMDVTSDVVKAYSNVLKIPLTYPDGVTPEPARPELTLTWNGDSYRKGGTDSWIPTTQDTFDADDGVGANFTLVNSGNIPLKIVFYLENEGVGHWVAWPVKPENNPLDPGKSFHRGTGFHDIGDDITPGTDTEDLLGTATVSFYYVGYDPDTYVDELNPGTELCRTDTITRTWKVRKPGTDPEGWEIPELSKISISICEFTSSSDPAGYQWGEWNGSEIALKNEGFVDVDDYILHVDYVADNNKAEDYSYSAIGPGWLEYKRSDWHTDKFLTGTQDLHIHQYSKVTAEDIARGYIQASAYVMWTDPDSGKPKQSPTVTLTLPVISKTGLLVKKGIEHGPANESWFQEGEAIPWTLTVTNNSKEPISNVTVTDEGAVVGTFAVINAGETVECSVPAHTVTEYEAKISGHVSNQAFARGTDIKGIEHTWPSNPLDVPTSSWSPVPLPPVIDPGTGDPDPGPGDPLPPGTPETPDTPGTPGGGDDPLGDILGVKVSTSIYKTTAHLPKNYEYYEEGEQADYKVTVKNTGETALENVQVYDSLHGLAPVETIPFLAPGEERTVSFSYIVSKDDVEKRGYVVNQVTISYDFLGMHGTPQKSNPVYIIAGENGHLPDGIKIDGIVGGTDSGDPLHPWFPGLTGLYTDDDSSGTGGVNTCSLTLDAMATAETFSTLHACADHSEAAKQAETASPAEAAAIWHEEINKLYDTLYEAGMAEAQAAVMNDKIAFEAYTDAYGALYDDKAMADLLRLRCAELCCMIHTAPDALPDSLLGSYATMPAMDSYDLSERIIGALKGSDSDVTIHMNSMLADAMAETKEILYGTKPYAADESFGQARSTWQRALDKAVNAKYKAADRDSRKTLAAWRQALDQMYAARKELLELLYSGNDDTAQECLMNLYRDASIDATTAN